MIVKMPETIYEKQIYNEVSTNEEYSTLSEGEKSILYDLCLDIHKYVNFDWSSIIIPNYVHNCYKGYTKNRNLISIQVIANCINACFPDKYATLEGSGMYESKRLVIKNRPSEKRR